CFIPSYMYRRHERSWTARHGSRKEYGCSQLRSDRTPSNLEKRSPGTLAILAACGFASDMALRNQDAWPIVEKLSLQHQGPVQRMPGKSCSMTAECRSIRASATGFCRVTHALLPGRLQGFERPFQARFEHRLQVCPVAVRLHQCHKVIFLGTETG